MTDDLTKTEEASQQVKNLSSFAENPDNGQKSEYSSKEDLLFELERLRLELRNQSIQAIPIRFAGFWMRFWAYLLDLIVIWSLERILINPIFRAIGFSLFDTGSFAPISIATAITFYAYFVLMTKKFGATLGKMVFGLKVVTLEGKSMTWGTVLFREWIGRFISVTTLVGYLLVAFLPKKQALHDLFVDTTVIHRS